MKQTAFCAVLCFGLLAACNQSSVPQTPVESASEGQQIETVAKPMTPLLNFADAANAFHASAQKATKQMLSLCSQMKADIDTFLSSPSEAGQSTAQSSYIACYQSWVSASLYFQQPFDLAEVQSFNNLVDLIDTRPYLPGYIDGIPEYPFSGLVHELDMSITVANLRSQHRLMDEESASVGFPVIEFFLWKVPVESVWTAVKVGDSNDLIERRKTYLKTAAEFLMEQLTKTLLRWQPNSTFASLPERAQLSFILKSLHRSVLIDLLTNSFEGQVLQEPEWFHPASISGHGRDYPILRLTQIQTFIKNERFQNWLAKQVDLELSNDQLNTAISNSMTAIQQLPENYPLETEENEQWRSARQQIAELVLMFSQLSEHFQVPVVTE